MDPRPRLFRFTVASIDWHVERKAKQYSTAASNSSDKGEKEAMRTAVSTHYIIDGKRVRLS